MRKEGNERGRGGGGGRGEGRGRGVRKCLVERVQASEN